MVHLGSLGNGEGLRGVWAEDIGPRGLGILFIPSAGIVPEEVSQWTEPVMQL